MIEILESYKTLKSNLGKIIGASGYKGSFIAQKIGMLPNNFYVKKQRGTWTEDEIEKILKLIENEQLENYFLSEIMKDASIGDDGSIEDLMSVLKA